MMCDSAGPSFCLNSRNALRLPAHCTFMHWLTNTPFVPAPSESSRSRSKAYRSAAGMGCVMKFLAPRLCTSKTRTLIFQSSTHSASCLLLGIILSMTTCFLEFTAVICVQIGFWNRENTCPRKHDPGGHPGPNAQLGAALKHVPDACKSTELNFACILPSNHACSHIPGPTQQWW